MPGYKQELANFKGASSHGSQAPTGTSSLCRHLLHMWSIGEISACACQSIAQAAHIDGINHESVVKLTAAGAWGKHTNNISRDLKAMVTKESKSTFALPTTVANPCWNPRKSCNEDSGFSFFDPVNECHSIFL